MKDYITKSGDTYDKIANDILGNEQLASEIMKANPNYIDVVIFSAGVLLKIPNVNFEDKEVSINAPSWRG